MKEKVATELKQTFRPEFLNRIDATVVFRIADRRTRSGVIVDLMLARVRDQLRAQEHVARGHPGGQGPHHQDRLRRGLRRAAAPPRDPEHGRGRARRAPPARPVRARARRSSSTRAPRPGLDIHAARGEDARSKPASAGSRAVARAQSRYVCQACGASFLRWEGQCRTCGAWNTLVETLVREAAQRPAPVAPPPAPRPGRRRRSSRCARRDVDPDRRRRHRRARPRAGRRARAGLARPARRRAGHRQVHPAPPGGAAGRRGGSGRVLYATGEESAGQVRLRAARLGPARRARRPTRSASCAETDVGRIVEPGARRAAGAADRRLDPDGDRRRARRPGRQRRPGPRVRPPADGAGQGRRRSRSSSSATSPRTARSPGRRRSSTSSTRS